MNKLTEKQKIFYILAAGVLVRLLYIIFMPVVNFAQYDLGSVYWDHEVLTGHMGYVLYLVKYHALPDFDVREVYQFNHPPVHYIISALVVSLVRLFTDDISVWVESVQIVSFVYSVITLFAVERILTEFKAPYEGKALGLILWAFQPTLIMTAGSVNNDGAGLMFQVLALWFALRWYKTRKYGDIFGVALTIGFGMLSKLSAGLVAVPIGLLFIYAFVKKWKDEKAFPVKMLIQYIVFGCVVAPIGLCWVIRLYVKWGVPPTYIAYLPTTSPQYVGMYSTFERLGPPNLVTLIKNLSHGGIGMGWNIWIQLWRTSSLGECDLSAFPVWSKLLCLLMMGINLVVMIWAFVAFIRIFCKKKMSFGKNPAFMKISMGILWIGTWFVMMYSYLSFANKYPHECSMNFRYVQLAILPPLLALSLGGVSSKKVLSVLRRLVVLAYVVASVGIIVTWCYVA